MEAFLPPSERAGILAANCTPSVRGAAPAPAAGRMQGREPCHKAISTKPRRPRGCQTSTSKLFIAVRPKAMPNALQSAYKRRPPSRHLAVSWRPQIRFYSGCASLRRLGRPGLAPAPPVCRREMSPVFGHLRKAPDLMLRQIVRALEKRGKKEKKKKKGGEKKKKKKKKKKGKKENREEKNALRPAICPHSLV